MILAFSLRPLPFHQDNCSFQFDADNKSRCLHFPVFLVSFVCYFSSISLKLINHSKLLNQPLNRGVRA